MFSMSSTSFRTWKACRLKAIPGTQAGKYFTEKEREVAKQNELEKEQKTLTDWEKVHNLRAWVQSQLSGSRHRGFRHLDVFVLRRIDTVPIS